ncbi:hypothetical protein ACIR03_02595 [Clostridium cochlearium]|uniref:hypothetical protein n=1 Tax=Clostridium cochlearium TaxID=1494 RepID=UPI001570B1FD|nr:hypothetical protein [Clostridium cochlearium]MBV1816882.1 hypothetical protein [Bacteroidales bacterium MSK.15.36]MCG4571753.1 hypothetical protein [Clostridium cochlearium]MCG4579082.1 hypothetical protein [Clostridium cochlearium]NSJ90160.1 hypothetical protein [Coprococcus sp. MSK.21.13]
MKYFKFKNPYSTIISAKTRINAERIYSENVCKIDRYTEIKEITKDKVVELWEENAEEPLHELVDLMQEECLILVNKTLIY